MSQLPPDLLLSEVDDILRSFPQEVYLNSGDLLQWAARANAVVGMWDSIKSINFDRSIRMWSSTTDDETAVRSGKEAFRFLHQVRYELLLKTLERGTKVFDKGQPFNYFDELRKLIERARTELFFVDQYLNADFVSMYLPFVPAGVTVELLGRDRMATLRPAVEAMKVQSGGAVEARSGSGFHDRYIFIDGVECWHSGASFAEGGKRTPTTLSQIVDAAPVLLKTYKDIWNAGA